MHSVSWNCTGSKLASGSVDQCVRVWSLDETGIHFPAYDGTMNQYGDFQFVPYWSAAE